MLACRNMEPKGPSMTDVDLPYFDQVIQQLTDGDKGYEQAWGKHVHWGYWGNPQAADGSVDDFAKAADKFCFKHYELANVKDGQAILDVGCGFGGNIELLNSHYNNMNLTGLNIDPRQIARAELQVKPKCKASNSIEFNVGNAVELPYADNQFDIVFALECIFHFPSREQFIAEAHRVLKPGGKLVFSDFVGVKYAMPVLQLTSRFTMGAAAKTLGHVLPFESMAGYLAHAKDTGFVYEDDLDITRNVLPSIPVYKALLGTGEKFVTQMFQTQARVSDSMRYHLVKFMILSFQKP